MVMSALSFMTELLVDVMEVNQINLPAMECDGTEYIPDCPYVSRQFDYRVWAERRVGPHQRAID